MDKLLVLLLLSAAVAVFSSPAPSPLGDQPPPEDIRQKLAEEISEAEDSADDSIAGRFWWLWGDQPTQKKKPSTDAIEIKQKLDNAINEPTKVIDEPTPEVASTISEIKQEENSEQNTNVVKEESEFENLNNLGNRMPEPTLEQWGFSKQLADAFVKQDNNERVKSTVDEISVKSTTPELEEEKKLPEVVTTTTKKSNDSQEQGQEKTFGFITKPVEALLNKPAQIISELTDKPVKECIEEEHVPEIAIASISKPSIIDAIKKPIESIVQKPVEIFESLVHKPKPTIQFPTAPNFTPVEPFPFYPGLFPYPEFGPMYPYSDLRPTFPYYGIWQGNPLWSNPIDFPQTYVNPWKSEAVMEAENANKQQERIAGVVLRTRKSEVGPGLDNLAQYNPYMFT